MLRGSLILFDFEESFDAKKVLSRGLRRFKEKVLHLDMWASGVGCFWKGTHVKDMWVRMVGLPLHLW